MLRSKKYVLFSATLLLATQISFAASNPSLEIGSKQIGVVDKNKALTCYAQIDLRPGISLKEAQKVHKELQKAMPDYDLKAPRLRNGLDKTPVKIDVKRDDQHCDEVGPGYAWVKCRVYSIHVKNWEILKSNYQIYGQAKEVALKELLQNTHPMIFRTEVHGCELTDITWSAN